MTTPIDSDQHPAGDNPPGAVILAAERVRDHWADMARLHDGHEQDIAIAIEEAFGLFVRTLRMVGEERAVQELHHFTKRGESHALAAGPASHTASTVQDNRK